MIVALDTGFLIVYTLFFVLFARAQGVATGTVGTRIMRARARLRARFALIDAIA